MERMVSRCCRIKSAVVMADEMDRGFRQILNFGHTVGHAIEAYTDYSVSHGRAVSWVCLWRLPLDPRWTCFHEEKQRILRLLDQSSPHGDSQLL